MSSITSPFGHGGDDSSSVGSTRPFEDDGYLGYDPRLQSQRFDSFSNYGDTESVKESAGDSSPIFGNSSYGAEDVISTSNPAPETPSPPSINSIGAFSTEQNGNGPILPPAADMEPEEGFALREWHRENAIRLEKKEKQEKEMLKQIIEEADEYKADFYRRRKITTESNKATNREKETQFLTSQGKFHAEAEKNYWKAIAELIPNEVPAIQKRGKKDNNKEKKPSIVVMQGPKPGKPTDLSRMRQILVKLKHNTPPHMKPKPPPPPPPQAAASEAAKDAKAAPPAATATPLK